ncbi:Ctr copper transporter family-domain-containing protein [Daldinia caldariorum]|uniref:Ctr copper transporter family-domain-containing protein n=1 Tax=Daldinia caldariorum TaxID=326644 RepID=UPI0020084ECD|nr:Ctr copper transporter family-domain-containing protein [Daldinia caldariorum]KAI1464294.1 Ctr copper transporter family-domain-containing protein [Daldinia caldariorum]
MDISSSISSMMSMSMSMPTSTSTTTGAASTETAMAGMDSHMDMGMGGNSCQINMLWNWYTVDACFISSSWHITSKGMFAGSCIAVILLGILLEFLRRSVKEYDSYLICKNVGKGLVVSVASHDDNEDGRTSPKSGQTAANGLSSVCPSSSSGYRPKLFEQAIRAFLHTAQFVVAYFLMLLAMYYNGYIIICIFIGAYIGSFIFQWEKLGGAQQTSAAKEATVCCG